MPRPKDGYKNAAGEKIPGTHDPINRFMDRSALMIWAHRRGEQGLPLWGRDAIDIGRTVHAMADLDLKGRPDKEIGKVVSDAGLSRDDYDKAMRSFMQFRKWRIGCHVQPIALEVSLVSEAHQYGGTPDCIALIDGKVALVEFKTSLKPFPDHLVAMAAHAALWNENHPDQPIEEFHWLGLPKDGSEFQHHAYADLSLQWKIFTGYLDLWRLEKGLTRKRATRPSTVAPKAGEMALLDALRASAGIVTTVSEAPAVAAKPKRTRKPKAEPVVAANVPKPRRTRKPKVAPTTSVPVVPAVVVTTPQRSASPWAARFVVAAIAVGTAVVAWMMREAA